MGTLPLTFQFLPAVLDPMTLTEFGRTDTTTIVIGCQSSPASKEPFSSCEQPWSLPCYMNALGRVFARIRC